MEAYLVNMEKLDEINSEYMKAVAQNKETTIQLKNKLSQLDVNQTSEIKQKNLNLLPQIQNQVEIETEIEDENSL